MNHPDIGRAVRIDAAGGTVARSVGTAGGGGDLGERFVERASGVFGRKATGALTALCISPTDLSTAAMEPDAHANPRGVIAYPQGVVRRWVQIWVSVM